MDTCIPLFQIDEDEQCDYPVPGTSAVFMYRRIAYSEREELLQLFRQRGQLDQRGYDLATFGLAIQGWRHFCNRQGEIPFPRDAPLLERRTRIAEAMARVPIETAPELLARIRTPSPEDALERFFASLNGSAASGASAPATATPASSVARNALPAENPSPVIPEV